VLVLIIAHTGSDSGAVGMVISGVCAFACVSDCVCTL